MPKEPPEWPEPALLSARSKSCRTVLAMSANSLWSVIMLLFCIFPVSHKLCNSGIGQVVLEQRMKHRCRHGGNICANKCRVAHMQRVANTCGKNLCFKPIVV